MEEKVKRSKKRFIAIPISIMALVVIIVVAILVGNVTKSPKDKWTSDLVDINLPKNPEQSIEYAVSDDSSVTQLIRRCHIYYIDDKYLV